MNPSPSLNSAAARQLEMDDWDFCRDALYEVSRTFSQPIQFLPPEQERALTVGYLLCRVADTIEDCTGIEPRERDDLFSSFQEVLRGEARCEDLAARFCRAGLDEDGAGGAEAPQSELRLMRELPRVMRIFSAQRPSIRSATTRWVSEMADGMRLYGRRGEGREFSAVYSIADLERYCYFVAGTVGHLITELFDEAIGQPGLEPRMREHAEAFGLGLQMVNIVKDVTDDFARGVCYLPRQLCRQEGFEPEELLAPQNRKAAHRVARRVADRAARHLESAFEYTLLIPASHHQLRLFCLLPLWMAVETLAVARDNEAIFKPKEPVKISRETVGAIIAECGRLCRDDDALRARFIEMTSRSPGPVGVHAEHRPAAV